MKFSFSKAAADFIQKKKSHREWVAVMVCLALVVVVGMVSTLKITGHAKVQQVMRLTCQLEDHRHIDECYDAERNLICGKAEFTAHIHNDDCWDENGELICELPEIRPHVHTESCYSRVEKLACALPAAETHIHTEDCYLQERVFVCAQPEGTVHTHTDECYIHILEWACQSMDPDHEHTDACYHERQDLICTLPETAAHVHTEDCYAREQERILTCGLAEEGPHIHTESCYIQTQEWDCLEVPGHVHDDGCRFILRDELICELEEGTGGHQHKDECYQYVTHEELICGKDETVEAPHIHSDACFEIRDVLICGRQEIAEGHEHTEECLVVEERLTCTEPEVVLHTHDDSCYEEIRDENGEVIERRLTCGQLEVLLHTHTLAENCFEVTPTATMELPGVDLVLDKAPTAAIAAEEKATRHELDKVASSFDVRVERAPGNNGDYKPYDPDNESFHRGDGIKFHIDFTIPKGTVKAGEPIVYQLPVVFSDVNRSFPITFDVTLGGEKVGKATITKDGTVTIILEETQLKDGTKFSPEEKDLSSSLEIWGMIDDSQDGKDGRYPFPGSSTTIVIDDGGNTEEKPDLGVKKTHTITNNSDGTKTIHYTVTVESSKGTDGELVNLEDAFEGIRDSWVPPTYKSVYIEKRNANGEVKEYFRFPDQGGGEMNINGLPPLEPGESYEITYIVEIDPEDYPADGITDEVKLVNHVTATSGDQEAKTSDTVTLQDAAFKKTGEYRDGKLIWTITVPAGSENQILKDIPSGNKLKELLGREDVTCDVTVTCTAGEHAPLKPSWEDLLAGYPIPCEDALEIVIVMESEEGIEDATYKNGASLGKDTIEGSVAVTAAGKVDKEGALSTPIVEDGQRDGIEFSWKSSICFPSDAGWSSFVYYDSFVQKITGQDRAGNTSVDVDHYALLGKLKVDLESCLISDLLKLGGKVTYDITYYRNDDFTDPCNKDDDNEQVRSFTVTFTNKTYDAETGTGDPAVKGSSHTKWPDVALEYTTQISEESAKKLAPEVTQRIKNKYGFIKSKLEDATLDFVPSDEVVEESGEASLEKSAKINAGKPNEDGFTGDNLSLGFGEDGTSDIITYRLIYMLSAAEKKILEKDEQDLTITFIDEIPKGLSLPAKNPVQGDDTYFYVLKKNAEVPDFSHSVKYEYLPTGKESTYQSKYQVKEVETTPLKNGGTKLTFNFIVPSLHNNNKSEYRTEDTIVGIMVAYRCTVNTEVMRELLAEKARTGVGDDRFVYQLTNHATAVVNGHEMDWVEHTTDVSKPVIEKFVDYAYEDSYLRLTYTLDINPDGRKLGKNGRIEVKDILTVKDVSSGKPYRDGFRPDKTEVKVYVYGEDGILQEDVDRVYYKYDVYPSPTKGEYRLEMELVDGKHMQVVYTYYFYRRDVDGKTKDGLKLTNKAVVEGYWSDDVTQDTQDPGGMLEMWLDDFDLTKTKTGDQATGVANAKFKVYEWDRANEVWNPVGGDSMTFKSDANGVLHFKTSEAAPVKDSSEVPLKKNKLYAVMEVEAPAGYYLSDEVIYFRWWITDADWEGMKGTKLKTAPDGASYSLQPDEVNIVRNPFGLNMKDDPIGPYYIKKVGVGSNSRVNLANVEFKVYTWEPGTDQWKDNGTVSTDADGKISFEPNADFGGNVIPLVEDGVYALVEVEAPFGYIREDRAYFYYYPGYKRQGGAVLKDPTTNELLRNSLPEFVEDHPDIKRATAGGYKLPDDLGKVQEIGKSSGLEIENVEYRKGDVLVEKVWIGDDTGDGGRSDRPPEIEVVLNKYTVLGYKKTPEDGWREFTVNGNSIWVPKRAMVSLKLVKDAGTDTIGTTPAPSAIYTETTASGGVLYEEYVFEPDDASGAYAVDITGAQIVPDGITVFSRPTEHGRTTLSANANRELNWKYVWKDLPLEDENGKYFYRMEEVKVPSTYDVTYSQTTNSGTGETTITVTNTWNPKPKEGIMVHKKWVNAASGEEDFARSHAVWVELWRWYVDPNDSEKVTVEKVDRDPVMLDKNDWSHSWSADELGEKDGFKYHYFVREVKEENGAWVTVSDNVQFGPEGCDVGYTGANAPDSEDADLPSGIEIGSNGATIIVVNITDGEAYALPETGGIGGVLSLVGAALVGGTGVALNRKRRRKSN